jgi:hypothetical protein
MKYAYLARIVMISIVVSMGSILGLGREKKSVHNARGDEGRRSNCCVKSEASVHRLATRSTTYAMTQI